MKSKRSRLAIVGVLTLALTATAGLTVGDAAAKKKKKKAATTFVATDAANVAIPDDDPTGASVPVTRTLTVGKKFKGRVVGDVNVTGLQTTGNLPDAADDLHARLTAPNGRTVVLFAEVGDQSLGPWTMDDDTKVSICDLATPPCENPLATLNRPFAGTANLLHNNDDVSTDAPAGPLSQFDGVGMRGAWTLTIWDEVTAGETSTLNQWGLQITRAFPVRA